MTDWKGEKDLDKLAEIAFDLTDRIREEDVHELRTELVGLCHQHPVKAAQVIMALSAWIDPTESTETLWARVESISASRVAVLDGRIQRLLERRAKAA